MKSEWKTSTIGAACSLVTDGSHSSPKSVESGEYMVSVKDFTEYGFDFTSCRRISSDDYETLKRNGCVPEQGDILIPPYSLSSVARVTSKELPLFIVLLNTKENDDERTTYPRDTA